MLKIFLSYSNKDKDLAGSIKRFLERYSLQAFLAHDDIKPTEEWMETILEELEVCHVFIPILTDDFLKSGWTGQETGIAVARKVKIISLKVTVDPPGFISRKQAIKLHSKYPAITFKEIVKIISIDPKLQEAFRDGIIKVFSESYSFDNAAENTDLLLSFSGYNLRQINDIVKHTISNDQIHYCFRGREKLKVFISGNRFGLDPRLYKAFDEITQKKPF